MLGDLIAALPPYAEDVKRTLTACLAGADLSMTQKWGIAQAAAEALACAPLLRALETESPLSAETRTAIRGVAAVMAMNNVYFRGVHLMKNGDYAHMRAGIRMGALSPPGEAAGDVDLWSIAVSTINACGDCLDAHEAKFRRAGGSAMLVQAAMKLAAALSGMASVLGAESAR